MKFIKANHTFALN